MDLCAVRVTAFIELSGVPDIEALLYLLSITYYSLIVDIRLFSFKIILEIILFLLIIYTWIAYFLKSKMKKMLSLSVI